MNLQGQGNDNGQQARSDASPQTRNISRLILFAKDERASNTTCIQEKKECVSVRLMISQNHIFSFGVEEGGLVFLTNSTKSDKTGTAECTLPLSSNIVRLEGHDHDNIRLHGCAEEKHAKISHSARRRPAHEGESDDGHDGIEQDLRPANAVLVAEPALHVHDHGSEGIWRCDEALTLGDGEAHSEEEDDREEEGDCVRLFDCAQKGQ